MLQKYTGLNFVEETEQLHFDSENLNAAAAASLSSPTATLCSNIELSRSLATSEVESLATSEVELNFVKTKKYKLKKMPMWNWDFSKKLEATFEWPTEEIFKQLPHDVFLESLEISSDHKSYK